MQFGVSQTLIALIILVTTVFILYSGRKLNEMVVNSIITAAQNERLVERLRIEIARAEKARRQTEEESERRSKFFAAANHDIRQPLQAMGIYIDILGRRATPQTVPVVKQLKKATRLPLDVHLMIANPLEQLPWFLDAGADSVTVHAEALDADGLARAVAAIHAAGAKAAVSVKPRTAVGALAPVLADLDMVLVMSVEPGFSGQSYIEGSEAKVTRITEMARAVGASPLIQVDGGIGEVTAPIVAAAGADVLVCGNAVFAAEDPAAALAAVQAAAEEARLAALAVSKEA